MKLVILGDTHCNLRAALKSVDHAVENSAEFIIQLGDFGFWTHEHHGVEFLDELNRKLINDGRYLVWLDGNHENHDHIKLMMEASPKTTNGHYYFRSRILYSPRGNVWTWNKKRFMTVGGAVSIDKAFRLDLERSAGPRTSWWDQEAITDEQVYHVLARSARDIARGKPVDYLFTHDCSDKTPFYNRLKPDIDSKTNRQKIDKILDAVQPKMHFHGHMHTKYDWFRPIIKDGEWDGSAGTQVYGIECDGCFYNWGVLDTSDNSFVFAPLTTPRQSARVES